MTRTPGGFGRRGRTVRAASLGWLVGLVASLGVAGEPPEPRPPGFRVGVGVLAAAGLGSMSTDLNGHPGFGLALQGYVPLASHLQLRPAFEWTGYRVNEYNLASRLLAEFLGLGYRDTRVVFRTYRFGVDGVLYFGETYRGPFASGGVGVQVSRVYVEDVAVYPNGDEEVTPLAASSATTGLWLGGGAGYQWRESNVELRVSRAPYRFTGRRPLGAPRDALPFEARPGWALHLILAVTLDGSRARSATP